MLEQRTYQVDITLGAGKYLPFPIEQLSDYTDAYAAGDVVGFGANAIGYHQHQKLQRALSEHAQCMKFKVESMTPTPAVATPLTGVSLHVTYDKIETLEDRHDETLMGAVAPAVPADFVANRAYTIGDRVTQTGNYYKAKEDNADASFTGAKWEAFLLEPAAYTDGGPYAIGNLVKYDNKYYEALVVMTAAAIATKPEEWKQVTAEEIGVVYDTTDRVIKYLVDQAFHSQAASYVDEHGVTQNLTSITSDDYMAMALKQTKITQLNATGGKEDGTDIYIPMLTKVTLPVNESLNATVKRVY